LSDVVEGNVMPRPTLEESMDELEADEGEEDWD